jgi:MFS superfamily sulfate permease-like transporter
MATARLAGLPAVAGLYAFVAGSLLYGLIGTNGQLSVGADSTIAPVLASGVALAATGTLRYAGLMAVTALLVGVLLVAVGAFRLGWIAEFLSTPVIIGVLAGIAVEIVVRQMPVILGVRGGGTTTVARVRAVIDQIGHANPWSVAIAGGVLCVIAVAESIDHRLPGGLLGLVLSIAAVDALSLASHHGVAILGAVHGGLPRPRLPSASWTQLRQLTGTVLTVAFVCIAQTAATIRASGSPAPRAGGFDRDLIGVGAGSIAAGLIGAFAVDASPPNTTIVTSSGGRSQLAAAMAAAVVLVVVLVATAPLAHLPQATLGATLVFIATKLFRVRELRTVLRFDHLEFALATVTLLVVALVGIEQGVVLAMILALGDRTRRSARPQDAVLGREPGTDHWIPVDTDHATEQVPGLLVYLVYAAVWYGNADYVGARIRRLVADAAVPVRAVVLDANGISDIDYTGLHALSGLTTELGRQGVVVEIARASHLVRHDLKHGALLELIGPDHMFASVEEAVAAIGRRP